MSQRPSWDLISKCLGTIGPLSVHPASPALLTNNGPLGDWIQVPTSNKEGKGPRAHLEFKSYARQRIAPNIPIISFTGRNSIVSSYPKRYFGRNQLLDSSISLSPLYLNQATNLHIRTGSALHHGFPWLQPVQEKLTIFRVSANMLCFRSFSCGRSGPSQVASRRAAG